MLPIRTLSVLSAILLATAIPAPAAAQSSSQWERELDAARELTNACVAERQADACEKRVSHLRAAMEAPDAEAVIRNALFGALMTAKQEHADVLLRNGQAQAAATLLAEAHHQMADHTRGGGNHHVWIDHQALLATLATALLRVDKAEAADTVAHNARSALDQYYAVRDRLRGQTAQSLLADATIGAAAFEESYAAALLDSGRTRQGAAKQAALASALEAYDRAIAWSERGIALEPVPTGDPLRVRIVAFKNGKAAAILALGDTREALEAYREAYASGGCGDVLTRLSTLQCERAQQGYLRAGGADGGIGGR